MNFIPIYPKPRINKIFPEISFDNFYCNTDANNIVDDFIVNDNLEPFDKFFNGKRSRNSSYDENDFQKILPYKPILNNQNSSIKFILNKKEINGNNGNNNNIEENNGKNICNAFDNITENLTYKNEENKKNKERKKVLFNSFQPNNLKEIQSQKQDQKIKNKLSARKSRLKKKLYVEQLEKEYILVKKELDEIKKSMSLNSNTINTNIECKENEKPINNNNLCQNCTNIYNLKGEENLIISEKPEKKNIRIIHSFTAKQRLYLEQLLIKQIQIMMPIKIKIFQNKYLKLANIDNDDNLSTIKNKIDENIQAIKELYDLDDFKDEEDNGRAKIKKYQYDNMKNKSMAYQIYNFYNNLKNYVNDFEKIYFSLI